MSAVSESDEAGERLGGAQGRVVRAEGAGSAGTGAAGLEPHGDAPVSGALHPAVPELGVRDVVAGSPPAAGFRCRGTEWTSVPRRGPGPAAGSPQSPSRDPAGLVPSSQRRVRSAAWVRCRAGLPRRRRRRLHCPIRSSAGLPTPAAPAGSGSPNSPGGGSSPSPASDTPIRRTPPSPTAARARRWATAVSVPRSVVARVAVSERVCVVKSALRIFTVTVRAARLDSTRRRCAPPVMRVTASWTAVIVVRSTSNVVSALICFAAPRGATGRSSIPRARR